MGRQGNRGGGRRETNPLGLLSEFRSILKAGGQSSMSPIICAKSSSISSTRVCSMRPLGGFRLSLRRFSMTSPDTTNRQSVTSPRRMETNCGTAC